MGRSTRNPVTTVRLMVLLIIADSVSLLALWVPFSRPIQIPVFLAFKGIVGFWMGSILGGRMGGVIVAILFCVLVTFCFFSTAL